MRSAVSRRNCSRSASNAGPMMICLRLAPCRGVSTSCARPQIPHLPHRPHPPAPPAPPAPPSHDTDAPAPSAEQKPAEGPRPAKASIHTGPKVDVFPFRRK